MDDLLWLLHWKRPLLLLWQWRSRSKKREEEAG